jgi:hypothetical protein
MASMSPVAQLSELLRVHDVAVEQEGGREEDHDRNANRISVLILLARGARRSLRHSRVLLA